MENMNITSKITVLHFIGRLGSGGIEKLLIDLYEHMDKDTIQYIYLLNNKNEKGFYDDYVLSQGAKIEYINAPWNTNPVTRLLNKSNELFKYLKNNRCDIFHIHGSGPTQYFYAYLAKKARIKKVILHGHSPKAISEIRDRIYPIAKNIFKSNIDYYIASSKATARHCWPKGIDYDNTQILLNGIVQENYCFSEEKRAMIREEYDLKNKFVVGHIGRFVLEKNHTFLLEIFREILNKNKNSVLLLLGSGKLENQIKKYAESLGVIENIVFIGQTTHISEFLSAMDVMCFPSLYEGLGIVVVEAQAAALRVVASDGVPSETRITQYISFLSLNKSAKEWADEVCETTNEYCRGDVSQLIREAGFDIRDSAKRLEQIYIKLVED